MKNYSKYGKGWFKESERHRLARLGIKTGRKINYMFSLETIKSMSEERAKEAKAEGKEPLTYSGIPEDLKSIPNIGDYRPKGWKLGEVYFVDNSGLGQPGEGALTFGEFVEKAKEGKGYAIIEAGQFQVNIGEFEKIDYSKVDIQSQINKVKSAYADTDPNIPYEKGYRLRNLDFEGTDFIDVKDSLKVMKPIGGYNRFTPEKTYKKLEPFSNKITVKVGREGSPVIYIKGSKETMKRVAKDFRGYADEIDIKNNTLRLWFD